MTDNRYHRQLLLPEIGEVGQAKLKAARVLLVGVGGLGSPIALYLTGAGVGTLGLVDDDVVSVSNLQRQVLYTEAEVGQSKALCAARRLAALNSEVCIEPHPIRLTEKNAGDIISRYDLVVDGCDNYATRFLLSDTCSALGVPYVYGAICGLEGQVAVLCHKEGSCTYRSLFPSEPSAPSESSESSELSNSSKNSNNSPSPRKALTPVVGVTPAIVGSVEAGEVLKLICGYGEPLIDRLWTIDLRTLQTYILHL